MERVYSHYRFLNKLAINHYQILTVAWNLFLVAVPLLVFLFLKKYWRANRLVKTYQKFMAAALFFLWLIFFPNTAYIITDVRHLLNYCPSDSLDNVCLENAWMIVFFFAYSGIGWASFYYLLKQMAGLIEEVFNKIIAKAFIILTIPVAALGVLLGLLNRFNSLDIFFYPALFIKILGFYFSNFNYFFDWLIFTVVLYLLYFAGDVIFRKPKC